MTIKPMPDGGLFGTMPSPEVQPDVVLTNWSVTHISSGADHWDALLGRCTESNTGRLSTPLIEFNAATPIALTRSGREYLLSGPPGTHEYALYVYEKQFGHMPHERKDVTGKYWNQIQLVSNAKPIASEPKKMVPPPGAIHNPIRRHQLTDQEVSLEPGLFSSLHQRCRLKVGVGRNGTERKGSAPSKESQVEKSLSISLPSSF